MPSSITKSALFALVGVLALVDSAHAAASDSMCDYLLTDKTCLAYTTQGACNAIIACEWITNENACYVAGNSNDAVLNSALAKTDTVSVEFKTKMEACEAVTAQSSCTSANDCEWDTNGNECLLSNDYSAAVTEKCAASSASTSFVAVQALVVAAVAAALLA